MSDDICYSPPNPYYRDKIGNRDKTTEQDAGQEQLLLLAETLGYLEAWPNKYYPLGLIQRIQAVLGQPVTPDVGIS